MTPRSIVVFRIGSLGDTLLSVPALWAVRRHFPAARITLLSDRHDGAALVRAADVVRGCGAIDAFMDYAVDAGRTGRWMRPLRAGALLARLRRARFDALIYLAPSGREGLARDRAFFRAAGIRTVLGMDGSFALPEKEPGRPLAATLSEADLLLGRLAASGVPVPEPGTGCMDLGIDAEEERRVRDWLDGLEPDGGRRWIAVGPGSKMPAKVWPHDRYAAVVAELCETRDVWPVVFGGAEDRELGDGLVATWKRGHNAAGALDVRAAAAALRRCSLYVGNDTGTMHLAAAVGVPCVALFSSRTSPGRWYPYGSGHRVFRTAIDCEGCGLTECVERQMECILAIQVRDVAEACDDVLSEARS